MNHLLVLLIFFLPQNPSSEQIALRKSYHEAIYDEKVAISLSQELSQLTPKNNLQMGYYGASVMMLAKHALMPNKKFKYFGDGKVILEKAIAQDPENPELVYLRYAIQMSVPAFLGYNKNIEKDKELLLNKVKEIKDRDLQKYILTFLITRGNLSDQERKKVY